MVICQKVSICGNKEPGASFDRLFVLVEGDDLNKPQALLSLQSLEWCQPVGLLTSRVYLKGSDTLLLSNLVRDAGHHCQTARPLFESPILKVIFDQGHPILESEIVPADDAGPLSMINP